MGDAGDNQLRPDAAAFPSWRLEETEPTNLLALWPDDEPPTQTEIMTALAGYWSDRVRVIEELEPEDPSIAWCLVVEIPIRAASILLWAEPAQPLAPGELEDDAAERCRWVVGVETPLDEDDPLTDFLQLMRMLSGALPAIPAVLDVNTAVWHPRAKLDEVFADAAIEPSADVLWVIQAVGSAASSRSAGEHLWLHTHGLRRCGRPELEMLEVPVDYGEHAAELIDDVAAMLLERPAPLPGAPLEIGTGLALTLQPWQQVAPFVGDDVPGGMHDREETPDNAHVGVRAVLCGLEPVGAYRKLWVWPRDVIDRLRRDEAGVFMTARATERQARMARAGWSQFATAFASIARVPCDAEGRPAVTFGIKAGFDAEGGSASREHLWFEICGFDADRAEGRLVNEPISVSGLRRGDLVWIARDQVSDWLVMTARGSFGPCDLASMWRAIDELRQQVESR